MPPAEGSMRLGIAVPPSSPKKSSWLLTHKWPDCLGMAAVRALRGDRGCAPPIAAKELRWLPSESDKPRSRCSAAF